MDQYEKKYNKIVRELIKKSFPELKNHKIIFRETKLVFGARVYYFYFFSLYLIGRGSEKGLSKGGMAHELSHLEIYKKWGFWKTALLSVLQFFSTKIRRKIEAGADISAIKKGHGNELYKTRKRTLSKADERIRRLIKKYYLSLEEIKQLTKKFKK